MKYLILSSILYGCSLVAYAPNELSNPKINKTYLDALQYSEDHQLDILLEQYEQHVSKLLLAFISVESRNNPRAYNKHENAAGMLQLRPIMVKHINQLLKKQNIPLSFTLKDRFDPVKSILIWKTVMDYHNPTYDIRKACLIWNGKGKSGKGNYKYYLKIKKQYNNI